MEYKDQKDGQGEPEIVIQKGRFLTWLDNYWYHYKWHTLGIGFAVLLLIVCFVQCGQKETGDVTVAYAGGYSMLQSEREAFVDSLDALALKKQDSEDTLTVVLNDYAIYSRDDESVRKLFTDEEGVLNVNGYENLMQQSVANMQTFGDYVMTGSTALYFVSEKVYAEQNLKKLAAPLTDYFSETPTSAYGDGYAIRLSETAFYKYYEALHFLPEDTLIVLTKPYIFGSTSEEATYAQYEELFCGIVNFKAP